MKRQATDWRKYFQTTYAQKDYELESIKNSQNSTVKKQIIGASQVAQWLRIHLPMQGTRVRALVGEDPTYHGATKPMRHNY